MDSSSSSSSIVSRAKTAFHSAAAKAERVLSDIKSDRKPNRESEKASLKLTKEGNVGADSGTKLVNDECQSISKNALWKVTNQWKQGDKRQSLDCTGRGKRAVESEKMEGLASVISENVDLPQNEEHTYESKGRNEKNCLVFDVPPASVIKQLAMALEGSNNWNSMKELSSSASEKTGLKFSVVKSLVFREKDKSTSEFCCSEEINTLICLLFNPEENLLTSSLTTFPMEYLPRDIRGAPPASFVIRLSQIMGSLDSLQKMASFWLGVVAELRRLWSEGQPIPHVPLDEKPDLNSCHLHQQLQVINCCIARKRRRAIAIMSVDSLICQSNTDNKDKECVDILQVVSSPMIYVRNKDGDLILRLGAHHPSDNLTMLDTDEPIYSPVTQEGPVLTEELIRETEEFVLRTGSLGAGCSQLLSDMQAFKAANPGCILEDFVRWHSPPDWTDIESDEVNLSLNEVDLTTKKGRLSKRMQKEGNLWRELWGTAKALPAAKQTPLFDEDLAVEGIFATMDEVSPSELFHQLFISAIFSSLLMAEGALTTDSYLFKLFHDCKDYIFSTCRSGISGANFKDFFKVYENIELIATNPLEAIEALKQSEEGNHGEKKNLFKIFSLNFTGKERHVSDKTAVDDQKKPDEKGTNVLSNLFDGKKSLFSRKNSKSSSSSPEPSCPEGSDWTVI